MQLNVRSRERGGYEARMYEHSMGSTPYVGHGGTSETGDPRGDKGSYQSAGRSPTYIWLSRQSVHSRPAMAWPLATCRKSATATNTHNTCPIDNWFALLHSLEVDSIYCAV